MIRKFLTWMGFSNAINVRRAHRAFRLNIGKAVLLHTMQERRQLEDDYENIYGAFPVLRMHPHPALKGDEALVSLQSEIRTEWTK